MGERIPVGSLALEACGFYNVPFAQLTLGPFRYRFCYPKGLKQWGGSSVGLDRGCSFLRKLMFPTFRDLCRCRCVVIDTAPQTSFLFFHLSRMGWCPTLSGSTEVGLWMTLVRLLAQQTELQVQRSMAALIFAPSVHSVNMVGPFRCVDV